jgi:hypothetical protein
MEGHGEACEVIDGGPDLHDVTVAFEGHHS